MSWIGEFIADILHGHFKYVICIKGKYINMIFLILTRALPGCLGSIGHFRNKFSDPIEQGQKHSATKRALATGRKTVRALVRKICHSFLRRTKALIKEQMPKKDDRVRCTHLAHA